MSEWSEDQELNLLRKIAVAARDYRDRVIAQRTLQLDRDWTPRDTRRAMLDIGAAEFELSDVLALWERIPAN